MEGKSADVARLMPQLPWILKCKRGVSLIAPWGFEASLKKRLFFVWRSG